MPDRGAQRKANFFKGTMRDPDAHTTPDAAIDDALIVVGASIDAQAKADGHDLSNVQRQRALSVAQRLLRALPRDQLQNISAHSGLLKSITDQSLAVAPITDPRAAAQARLDERGQGVGTGDPATALLGRRGLDGMGTSSFARLTELGGATSTEMARTIEHARSEAFRLGMPWAANNPDLLRLGAGAIKAIAETNLKEAGYKALREGSHYQAQDIVAFAKHSKIKGFDAEKAAHATRDLVQGQPAGQQPGLAEVLKGYDRAVVEAHEKPNDPAARQRLEEAGQRQKAALQAIAAQSAEQAERVRRFEESKKVEAHLRATAPKVEAKADAADAKIDDVIAGLNEPQTPKADAPKVDAKMTPPKGPVPLAQKAQAPK